MFFLGFAFLENFASPNDCVEKIMFEKFQQIQKGSYSNNLSSDSTFQALTDINFKKRTHINTLNVNS